MKCKNLEQNRSDYLVLVGCSFRISPNGCHSHIYLHKKHVVHMYKNKSQYKDNIATTQLIKAATRLF